MSARKFAPMTDALLARKGDAAPSIPPGRTAHIWARDPFPHPVTIDHPDPAEPPVPLGAPPASFAHEDPAKVRRIMVCVTPNELERLGIAAIKKGRTRHEIVREALEAYFEKLGRELPGHCNCMMGGAGPCCS